MSHATDMLDAYEQAELAVLSGKEWRIGDRVYKREDLDMIRAGRKEWERRVLEQNRAADGISRFARANFN